MPPPPSPRARLTKRIVWSVVFLAAAGGAFWGVRAWRNKGDEGPKYETAEVDQGRITAKVTATGTVSALVTVQVGSQVSGRLQQIMVDFNSQVKKGEVIAKIDPELFRASIEQARANFMAAKGNLAKAKAQADDAAKQAERSKQLAERNLVAPADRDTAVATAAAAAAQVDAVQGSIQQAQAALHQAQISLDYTTIVSPIDGVVISRSVDVGQTVAASLQAPTLFTIAEDLKKMQVDTSVAEADVGKLEPGMAATFTVDAYPTERFRGKVRQIRNAPQTVQNVVTYDAVIDVDNSSLKLKPGMTANVTFVYADRRDVVRVPNAALRFRPPGELAKRRGGGGGGGAAGGDRKGGIRPSDSATPPTGASPSSDSANPSGPTATAATATPATSASAGSRREHRHHRDPSAAASGDGPETSSPAVADAARGGERSRSGDGARPNPDLGYERPADSRTIWILRGATPESVAVRIGLTDGTFTEIVEGEVHPGDAVITGTEGSSAAPTSTSPPGGAAGGMRRLL